MLVLVPATSPLWFPWLLRGVAHHYGFQIGATERVGWGRVRLREVRGTVQTTEIHAGTVELPQLLNWLFRLARHSPATNAPVLSIADWSVRVGPSRPAPDSEAAPVSTAELLDQTTPIFEALEWVTGPITLERGQFVTGGSELRIPSIQLDPTGARAEVTATDWQGQATIHRTDTNTLHLNAALAPWDYVLDGQVRRSADHWDLSATLSETTHRLDLSATFAPGAVLPTRASLRGEHLQVPLPSQLQAEVHADLQANWENGIGTARIRLAGETRLPPAETVVPVTGDARARFDLHQLTIDALRLDSDPVRVLLSQPINLVWSEWRDLPPATLKWAARLGPLTDDHLHGDLTGTVDSEGGVPGGSDQLRLRFSVRGSGLGVTDLELGELRLDGTLRDRALEIATLRIQTPSGGEFNARGALEVDPAVIQSFNWEFRGVPPLPPRPVSPSLPSLVANGTTAGPLTNLVYQVNVSTEAPWSPPGLKTLTLQAAAKGTGLTVEDLSLQATTENDHAALHLRARGSFEAGRRQITIGLQELELRRGSQVDWALTSPVATRVQLTASVPGQSPAPPLEVALEPLRLQGAAGDAQVSATTSWPERGELALTINGLQPGFLTAWLATDSRSWTNADLTRVELRGSWDHGPLNASLDLAAALPVPEIGTLWIQGEAEVGPEGTQLRKFRVYREGQEPVEIATTLPVVIDPSAQGRPWSFHPDHPWNGEVTANESSWVWDWLAERTGVRSAAASLHLAVSGTPNTPEAELTAHLGATPWPGADTNPALALDEATVRAHLAKGALTVDEFRVQVAGQEARARGRLPIPAGLWEETPASFQALDWRQAEGQVVIGQAELAPLLSAWTNAPLQASGILRADLALTRGTLNGWLDLTNLATHPFEPIGTFREVSLRLAVAGNRVEIERGQATLSGQPLNLSGWATLPDFQLAHANAEVQITATNVALVRAPNLLLRADLDLALTRTNPAAPPTIGGAVTLGQSVVIVDVRDLVAVDLERPERRPPYFSISQPALADWRLDLRVRGTRFARVLSPAFRGSVSADAQLIGTLGSPRLLGEGLVDSGQIVFPFGQLQIQQARVRFTDLNPYQPQLEGRAEGMNFGYTVSLDLGGTLDNPQVRFESVPPMSTREVLQMLTAGNLPNSEYTYSASAKAQNVGAYLASDLISSLTGDPSEESRLTLRSGQRVTTNGRLTYGVEYRLSDRWSLVGEYDRWSQFNAGVRWRVVEK